MITSRIDTTQQIHPSAVVEAGARVGPGCVVHAHAFIGRNCHLDAGVVVHPFAVLGGDPQDLSFDPGRESTVRIGARTVIREHVTVNRASQAGAVTGVGADCFLMAAAHVAHDCQVGDRVVIANAVLLGGHVHIGDRAFLGGGAVIHQFCRVGEVAMVGGGARISRDVPPFCMVAERNDLIGLNVVGLRRLGIGREALRDLKQAFHTLDVPVGNLREIAGALLTCGTESGEARRFLEFFGAGRRGFARTRAVRGRDVDD